MSTQLTLLSGRIVQKPVTPHLTTERLAAFLDDRLTSVERTQAVLHFAECADCRHELAESRGLVRSAPPRDRWRWIAGASAAALLLAVALPRLSIFNAGDPDGELGAVRAAEETPSITITAPADAATIAAPFTFGWRAAGPGTSYLFVVQDSVGTVLFRVTTSDTGVTLPDTTRLAPGSRYYWSVDARRSDGQSVKTNPNSFRVR